MSRRLDYTIELPVVPFRVCFLLRIRPFLFKIRMDIQEVMASRHSVRNYDSRPIGEDKINQLKSLIDEVNAESGLHIQLVSEEPRAFDSALAHYGKFSGVRNYIALVGKKGSALEEKSGYYGEKIVLKTQSMGLNTCWVGLTFKKVPEAVCIGKGEKLVCVIALGYGLTQGVAHKVKAFESVAKTAGSVPEWFRQGVEAALLAPTAMNQQKFAFELKDGNVVQARSELGFFTKVDLGIVKLHFELGAGPDNFAWR